MWGPYGHWAPYGYAGGLQEVLLLSRSGTISPSITGRRIGVLEHFPIWGTVFKKLLCSTWIRCFSPLFISSLIQWRIFWRLWTKMAQPSNTCVLFARVLVLLNTRRAPSLDLRSKESRTWEAFKSIYHGFLGNRQAPNYQGCIESCYGLMRILSAKCPSRSHFSTPTSTSFLRILEQWMMSIEKATTKMLQWWRTTTKASGSPRLLLDDPARYTGNIVH